MKNIIEKTKTLLENNKGSILTGLGVASIVASGVILVKNTPKVYKILDVDIRDDYKFTKEDYKKVYKLYVPPLALGVLGGCLVAMGNRTHIKQNAALSAAYLLGEEAFDMYKKRVVEAIGATKEENIRKEIAQDVINNNKEVIVVSDKGSTLFYDEISGRYFKSDIDTVKNIINELNRELNVDQYVCLNDLYYELGLSNIPTGDYLGWNIYDGLIDIKFGSHLTPDMEPCIYLEYINKPKPKFNMGV